MGICSVFVNTLVDGAITGTNSENIYFWEQSSRGEWSNLSGVHEYGPCSHSSMKLKYKAAVFNEDWKFTYIHYITYEASLWAKNVNGTCHEHNNEELPPGYAPMIWTTGVLMFCLMKCWPSY